MYTTIYIHLYIQRWLLWPLRQVYMIMHLLGMVAQDLNTIGMWLDTLDRICNGFVWNRVSSCDSVTSCVVIEEDFDEFCIFKVGLRLILIGVRLPYQTFPLPISLKTFGYDSTFFDAPNSWMMAIQKKTGTETWSQNLSWKHDPPNLSWEPGGCWA